MRLAVLVLTCLACLRAQSDGGLAQALAGISMDPNECYHVRDISLVRDEAKTYFDEGYLIFAQPIAGHRAAAVFVAEGDGGDAELLLLPPTKAERRSLALHAETPNLDEHFTQALLLFGDVTYEELMRQIKAAPRLRKAPEQGAALAVEWTPVARNLSAAFATRTTLELLSPGSRAGFFAAILNTRRLGTIDLLFDPRSSEQLILGQLHGGERSYFEVWTSFQARGFRQVPAAPDVVVEHYRIDATLDARLRLRCVSTLTVRVPGGSARAVPLEMSSQMAVTGATVDGQPATVVDSHAARTDLTQDANDRLFVVVPGQPLSAAAAHEIRVEHEGDVISSAAEGVYFVGSRGRWYPHRGAQFSTFDVTYHYGRGVDLVSPGELLSDSTDGEIRSVRRDISVPVPFLGFNLGAYTCLNRIAGAVTVKVCASPQMENALRTRMTNPERRVASGARGDERLQTLASEVADAMQFYTAHFGPPPLRELVAAPIPGTFGQGFAGLIYLSAFTYLNEADPAVVALSPRLQFFFQDLLQAHEVAHQWWGNSVSAASYRDEWLMEALANYSAILWLETRKGPVGVWEMLSNYRDQLLSASPLGDRIEAAGPVTQGRRLQSPANPRAFDLILYGKGTWILHMLRRRMGDAAFWQVLAQVLAEYRHKTISTEQFRKVCAQHMPADSADRGLDNFFEQWVDATGVPELALTSMVKRGPRGYTVSGHVAQSGVDGTFQAEAPVVVQPAQGAPVVRWVLTGAEPAAFSMLLKAAPARVTLDPDFSVLRR